MREVHLPSKNPVKAQQRLLQTLSIRIEHRENAADNRRAAGIDESISEQHQQHQAASFLVATASSASTSGAHPRQLLQDTLWPLTHDTVPSSCDLQPHAAPKAKELYDILLQGLPPPPWYMLNPDGTCRMLWDFLLVGAGAALIDPFMLTHSWVQAVFTIALVVFVPVLIAFHSAAEECTFVLVRSPVSAPDPLAPPQPASAMQFMLLTNLAFLLDIPLNFVTGMRSLNPDTGIIEYCYTLKRVAIKYARTWLVLDVLSALPVECMITAGNVEYNYNLGHLNRLLKVFGLKRRAHGDPLRLINRLPYIRDNFNYSLRLVVLSSSLLLLGLHYFACALWLVLRVQGFPAETWPVQLGLLDDINVYQCWTWCVFAVASAMIGLGYGSYPPVTFPEAVLWIVEMISMAGGFAVVNGFILSAILEFLAGKARYKAKLTQVQRELHRRNLQGPLAERVMAFFELKHRDHNMQDSHEIMVELAPGLRQQVALSAVGHLLSKLAVVRDTKQLLHRTALVMRSHVAPEGQLITIPGSPQQRLYFLTRGYADLYMGDVLVDTLVAGDSFGEMALLPVPYVGELPPRLAALWSTSKSFSSRWWPTLFSVRALSNCSLVALEGNDFAALLEEYEWAQEQLQALGRHYARVLDALPMLDKLWKEAAEYDPLRSPGSLMLATTDERQHLMTFKGRKAFLRKQAGLGRPGQWPLEHSRTAAGVLKEGLRPAGDSGHILVVDGARGR